VAIKPPTSLRQRDLFLRRRPDILGFVRSSSLSEQRVAPGVATIPPVVRFLVRIIRSGSHGANLIPVSALCWDADEERQLLQDIAENLLRLLRQWDDTIDGMTVAIAELFRSDITTRERKLATVAR
jgi:hypothetical protein